MVDQDLKKWQGLESRLSDGLPLWSACLDLGIPVADAREYLEGRREDREEPEIDEAVLSAAKAREVALKVLYEAVDIPEVQCDNPEIEAELEMKRSDLRLDAAKELLRHYREERKRLDKKADGRPKKTNAIIQYGDWYFS